MDCRGESFLTLVFGFIPRIFGDRIFRTVLRKLDLSHQNCCERPVQKEIYGSSVQKKNSDVRS